MTILLENELINIIQSTERMDRKFTDAEIKNFFENFILESIKHEEIEPWKVRSRKNRVVFKPIIRIDESYLLSIRLIETSQKMIDAILIEGIFPISLKRVKNEELKNSVEKLRRRITNLFEKDVKDLTKGFFPIVEESALKNPGRIWGIPNFLNTQIDILGICPKNKIIAIIEVKDFGLTLDVREIKREIKNFTTKDGYFEKNSKRCEEVNKYLKRILMYYNLNYDPKYQILGIFVLKDVKMTGFVINTDQKVFSYEEYNEWLREVVN